MMRLINVNGVLYNIKRTFKPDGWFGNVVQNMNVTEIERGYHVDKLLKDSNGYWHLADRVDDVEPI
jgi:hypothetical protein